MWLNHGFRGIDWTLFGKNLRLCGPGRAISREPWQYMSFARISRLI
jgi:hypothetical protein